MANNSPGRKTDKNRKMIMSREYANSVKRLKGLTIKAERMLLYMEMCRKYETQDEKILPPVIDHATLETRRAATHNTTGLSSFNLVRTVKSLSSFFLAFFPSFFFPGFHTFCNEITRCVCSF